MESAPELTPELKQLIEAVLEERCSADDLAKLEHLLVTDVEARRSYVQYVSTLAGVRRCLRGRASSLISQLNGADGDTDPQRILDHVRSVAAPQGTAGSGVHASQLIAVKDNGIELATALSAPRSSSAGRVIKSISLAAVFLVGITLLAWSFLRTPEDGLPGNDGAVSGGLAVEVPKGREDDGKRAVEDGEAAEPVYVARLTDSHEAVWAGMEYPNQGVSMLAIGQEFEIASGLAEIVFDNGAKVLLEGPAKLVFDSRTQATLAFGQLTAQVPPQAIGFTIQTPAVNVVDLGTEFGVRVSEQGMTDVAVFSGEVIAAPREAGTAESSVRVLADELRRFIGPNANEEPLGAPTFTKSIPSSVEIANPGFELPKIGGWLVRELSGWTIVSQPAWEGLPNAGVMLVTPERCQLPSTSEGHQWGFLETRRATDGSVHNTTAFQPVGTLAPQTLYRLQVTIGREGFQSGPKSHLYPFSSFEGLEIGLWAGPDENLGPTEPLRVVRDPSPSLKAGGTETVTLEYLSPGELPPGSQTLFIKLSIDGQDWCRVLFDNVRLEAVSNSAGTN